MTNAEIEAPWNRIHHVRRFVRVGSLIGTVHFALGVLLWTVAVGATALAPGRGHINWSILLQTLPAVALLVGFYVAWRLGRSHLLVAGVIFVASLLGSIASFRSDMANDRYQLHIFSAKDGCSHAYLTWFWWEYDR